MKIQFDDRLSNRRKDIKRYEEPQADEHFKQTNYDLNQHDRFNLIEQLNNVNIEKDLATLRLKKREDSWILQLKALHPYILNYELAFASIFLLGTSP